MDRTEAWSRSLLLLISPTGTGYVNYVATACVQYLTRGDVASVTLQYSKRPSPLSLGKVKAAAEQNRLLWLRIFERVRAMSPEDRPKVVLFGESLGALTSQNVLIGWGTLGLQALGIDRALWVGTPETSAWMHEVTGEPRPDVDKSLVAMVNDYEQFCDLGDDGKERVRYVLLSHDNDGVTKFGPRLINRRPAWLGPQRPAQQVIPGRSPRGIPPSMQLAIGHDLLPIPDRHEERADPRCLPGVGPRLPTGSRRFHSRCLRPRLHSRTTRSHQACLPATRRVPGSRLSVTHS